MADSGSSRRVVVTGVGVVTSIGHTVGDFWEAMQQGKSGVGPIERFFQNDPHFLLPGQIENFDLRILIAAQIKGFDYKARLRHSKRDKIILFADRYSLFAAAAADEAIKQSGLEIPFKEPYRAASVVGSAEGGISNLEIAYRHIFELKQPSSHPLTLVRFIGSSAAAHIGIECGVKGPTFGVCSACASGGHAIKQGLDFIRNGLVDVAIVGASEAPTPTAPCGRGRRRTSCRPTAFSHLPGNATAPCWPREPAYSCSNRCTTPRRAAQTFSPSSAVRD